MINAADGLAVSRFRDGAWRLRSSIRLADQSTRTTTRYAETPWTAGRRRSSGYEVPTEKHTEDACVRRARAGQGFAEVARLPVVPVFPTRFNE